MNLHLEILANPGLAPNWDKLDFSDQEQTGCECAKESREMEAVADQSAVGAASL